MKSIMTREEFIEAHRKECRRFFEIMAQLEKWWAHHRTSADGTKDNLAEMAARILSEETETLQDRMKAGSLAVLGFDR